MSDLSSLELRDKEVSSSSQKSRESNETAEMDDPEKTLPQVAQLIDQLHLNQSSAHEKELTTARLLGIAKARKEARRLIGSHGQAMPLFISILRNGTLFAKVNVASTLTVLCRDEDIRLKVLLGGCIPPLLSLLKSDSPEARKAAAEAIFKVSPSGVSDDHFGMKIFITEGVVPTLWEQLNPKQKPDKAVEGFVVGALRNLCGDKDGHWRTTLEGGGVDIIVKLLSCSSASTQSNAASLLARMMLAFSDSIPKVIDSGGIKALFSLLAQQDDVSVRASAAEALEVLTSKSTKAKKAVVDSQGVTALIGAVIAPSKEKKQSEEGEKLQQLVFAPSKERKQGEVGEKLQRHAIQALANICGGMSPLLLYLGELAQSPRLAAPVADIIGALAYALMVFEHNAEEEPFDATKIENILAMLLKPRDNKLVQERLLEAMASLYGNAYLSKRVQQSESKKALTGLTTMASGDALEYLILSLLRLCCDGMTVWEAIGKREGIQLLISLLGLSSEKHQEYAVEMLAILTNQINESKWAITAAGGIPPLVQLLEMGSQKARENAALIIHNLCCHSEDIRACAESAGAIQALLSLLKNGESKGQEASSRALTKLITASNPATTNQLLVLLLGDLPSSKAHVTEVLGHVLTLASHSDLVNKGAAANQGLMSIVHVLNSSNEQTQVCAASVLADVFSTRHDICDSLATDEVVNPCMKLLGSNSPAVATQSARVLRALSRASKEKSTNKMPYIGEGHVKPLIKLAKTAPIDSAATAMAALANLLSDPEIAAEALQEDVVSALTRVLGEGSSEGRRNASRALHKLLRHFPVEDVFNGSAQCRFAVLAMVESLNVMNVDGTDTADALDVIALLTRTKQGTDSTYRSCLAEVPSSLEPLVHCLSEGSSLVQDKAIEILSRLCGDQPVFLGNLLLSKSRSIGALADRIINSCTLEVRVGGTALIICAAKEHELQSMDGLDASGYLKPLIYALVDMMKPNCTCSSLEIEVRTPRGFTERTPFGEGNEFEAPDPAIVLGGTVALWLLSIISSFHVKNTSTVVEAGGLEALADKLARHGSNPQAEDAEGTWISALLLAILFQNPNIISSPTIMRIIPSLALLLKSDEMIVRLFAAHAIASLVCHRKKGINLTVVNSGAITGLISLIGHIEIDMPNLVALSEEFSLVRYPDQVSLEVLFEIEEVRVGSAARRTIPLLVDLLKPLPDRAGAPPLAVRLLTQIADGNDENKSIMAEAGALDVLAKYLSLSPQDLTEATISELLRIIFSNSDLIQHQAAVSCSVQLIAVLRLGSRSARLSAASALKELFDNEKIRNSAASVQAVQPLADMLDATSESEQYVALSSLVKLTSGNDSKAAVMADLDRNPLESLYKILSSSSPMELKSDAAELCFVLFGDPNIRILPIASECLDPLVLLMQSDVERAVESAVCAFERLLDDEHPVDLASANELVGILVHLISGSNHRLIEASIFALIKLGKDRTPRKLDMVKAGILENCLELLPTASSSLCSTIVELFRVLTNSSAISKSPSAAKIVEPLFTVLQRSDFGLWGQHSALQTLLNILEKPQCLATLKLTPSQVIEPLISFLESPAQAIQQLGTELLSHLLAQEHFKQDITSKNAVVPLVQLAGIGILNLQQTAISALESISLKWPNEVADAGGIFELSKVIVQDDPLPPDTLWESAAMILCNVIQSNADYYLKVPLVVLVKMLYSTVESTVTLALNALIDLEKTDLSNGELMAEAGAVDALLDLLRSHQYEEASAGLIEALFNNVRIRELKVSKYAIAPLAQYLLDPQTTSQSPRLLAALALGDLSQHEGLARATDSVSACRALISLLEDHPTEEMTMVAICALQNFVMHSRTNRRAVAEAGGILLVQELLLSPNSEIVVQAALLIRFLFSNHTLKDYASNELIRSLTAALEKEFCATETANEEILKSIYIIFSNFPKLQLSEAGTLCIPYLVTALKSGSEAAQDSVLTTLCLLQQSWSTMPIDVSKSQAMVAAEAIPILQMLIKTSPPGFHERADSLLHCLPGCLTVTIKRANNLRHVMGGTNPFCRLTIANGPARQTKVVSRSTSPEWNEGFTWAFDVPPKGQKLQISCKGKTTFGKSTLGSVTIQIDKVVNEGIQTDTYSLSHERNKDGSSQTLEVEITWSNRTSNESVK
ncbi:protein CELLULOSE SYNTHASE INTERACTIVE 3-like [Lycium barbarum]|uniref:protein CELLULOSE SYNTHASE INTERACTIVE 3-like n=1 Tax=Lycium barbarum TaxID=112863 RepID=UPI00293E7E20|nr:protein CELLULOSE SYNTHASE INTERACTIVE 3-like [Lycium barbarum]